MAIPTELQLDIAFAGLARAGARPTRNLGRAEAWIRATGKAIRRARAAWQRRMHAADTYHALSGLDARTLRDIGLDRSELASVVAAFAGEAEPTRFHAERRDVRG